ncbi:MAG: helicase HerA-like domain-containing protein [Pseudomonadota bacterium]
MSKPLVLGANTQGKHVHLFPSMGNRHGLIAGATGTGKTITLQILAEAYSDIGVPVFTADVKGDLSGISQPAKSHLKIDERIEKIGIDGYQANGYPVRFWDIYGKTGHVVRTTIQDMGPDLLANLMELTEAQASILYIAFTYADDEGLPLLDLKDLKSLISFLQDNAKDLRQDYGSMSTRSLGALQRKLLVLEEQGGDQFFGEPALSIHDFMQQVDGKGIINLLDGRDLILNPGIYTTFLLWFLTELFEELEEQGDADKPRFVFFFDEAHLLFDNAPKALLQRLEQVVRIIRSKGVGVYFVTQSPSDIPDDVLGQLGNRIQHALRAFTPKEKKAVRVAAQSFRENPDLDTETVIMELGVGEALVSVLDEEGVPTMVEQTLMVPPQSLIGPSKDNQRDEVIDASLVREKYDEDVDSVSAYEMLQVRRKEKEEKLQKMKEEEQELTSKNRKRNSRRQGYLEAFGKTLVRSLASGVSRRILKTAIGAIARR